MGAKKPAYAGSLLSNDLHLADYDISGESELAGKTLMELNLATLYGVHVTSILRGKKRINIPGGKSRIYPYDKIQVIGTDEQLSRFSEMMEKEEPVDLEKYEKQEMILKQLMIDPDSMLRGKTLKSSGIRDRYHCFIAAVERENNMLMTLDVNTPFEEGDVLWIVGEKDNVYQLLGHRE